jgi:outer membrane protein assembly factor BamB
VPVGEGFSSPVVAEGRVYVTDAPQIKPTTQERVQCFDEPTGRRLWAHTKTVHYPRTAHGGPVATPIVRDGKLYHMGWSGMVRCLDSTTGAQRWEKDLGDRRQEFESTASPLLEGNLLIVCFGWKGAGEGTVYALDKDSGAVVWRTLGETATSSSPVVISAGGARQLIVWTGESISSLVPATGAVLWREQVNANWGVPPVTTPVFEAGRLLVGARMFQLDPQKPSATLLWPKDIGVAQRLLSDISTALIHDGHVFSLKTAVGKFVCLDATTGELRWQTERIAENRAGASVHVTLNGDSVLMFNERGELIRARLTPTGYEEISRTRLIEPTHPTGGRNVVWSPPSFANGRVFVRTDKELVCVDLKKL